VFWCALKAADQVHSHKDGVIVSFFSGEDNAVDQLQDSNSSSYLSVFNLTQDLLRTYLTYELLLRRDNPPSSFLALIGIANRTLAGLHGFLESIGVD